MDDNVDAITIDDFSECLETFVAPEHLILNLLGLEKPHSLPDVSMKAEAE